MGEESAVEEGAAECGGGDVDEVLIACWASSSSARLRVDVVGSIEAFCDSDLARESSKLCTPNVLSSGDTDAVLDKPMTSSSLFNKKVVGSAGLVICSALRRRFCPRSWLVELDCSCWNASPPDGLMVGKVAQEAMRPLDAHFVSSMPLQSSSCTAKARSTQQMMTSRVGSSRRHDSIPPLLERGVWKMDFWK